MDRLLYTILAQPHIHSCLSLANHHRNESSNAHKIKFWFNPLRHIRPLPIWLAYYRNSLYNRALPSFPFHPPWTSLLIFTYHIYSQEQQTIAAAADLQKSRRPRVIRRGGRRRATGSARAASLAKSTAASDIATAARWTGPVHGVGRQRWPRSRSHVMVITAGRM